MEILAKISKAASSDYNISICISRIDSSGIKYHISGNSVRLITLVNLSSKYRAVVFVSSMIVVHYGRPT